MKSHKIVIAARWFFVFCLYTTPILLCSQVIKEQDSITRKDVYGIRIGADLGRPIIGLLDENYEGVELTGDLRIKPQLWLAVELGSEKRTQQINTGAIPLYNFTASGSYLKLGVDYNTYDNWFGQHNQIIIGGRLGFSSFSNTVNNFNFFDTNRIYGSDGFVVGSIEPTEFGGLNATWLEFIAGFRAELLPNIYGGITARLAYLVSNKSASNFDNLWIPGFNKVTNGANWGLGFNYTLSYFIPLLKKKKTVSENLKKN